MDTQAGTAQAAAQAEEAVSPGAAPQPDAPPSPFSNPASPVLAALSLESLPAEPASDPLLAAATVAADLRAALPALPVHTLGDLIDACDTRRILIVRPPAGVSYETLFSILAALVLNAGIAAVFLVSTWIVWRSSNVHDTWGAEEEEGGNGGFVVQGTGGLSGDASIIGRGMLEPLAGSLLQNPPPSLPELPPAAAPALAPLIARNSETPLLGVNGGAAALEAPRPTPRRPALPVDVTNITGPQPTAVAAAPAPRSGSLVTGTGGTRGTGTVDRGGTGAGTGDEGEERVYDLMKPGAGRGRGSGNGSGNGLDRGPSAANLAEPAVLWYPPPPEIPQSLLVKLIGKKITFEITVLANGQAGEIKTVESSGSAEIDTLFRAQIPKFKFRPAYVAGRPVAKAMRFTYGNGE